MATTKKPTGNNQWKNVGDIEEFKHSRPNPWENILRLFQGKGCCDPKGMSDHIDTDDKATKSIFSYTEVTLDSTAVFDDLSDISSVTNGGNINLFSTCNTRLFLYHEET